MFSSISRTLFKKAIKPSRLTTMTWRGIKLHEYQAAQLLKSYGVPVPNVSVSNIRSEHIFWDKLLIHHFIGICCLQSR